MDEPLLSSNWYRVAALQPRLRGHARLHRMRYRGELWYLVQDPVSGRVHRFSPAARLLISAMDGQRTVQQLWELANRRLQEDAPTQDEVIRLLAQLHAADLLQSDVTPDVRELFERGKQQERAAVRRSYLNPMAIRLHLWDPDAVLNRVRPLANLLWSPWGALLWLLAMVPALVLLPMHWAELTGNFADRMLTAGNLVALWLVFPLVKAAHEFGHAAAVKRGGGEVHDVGVVLLVLMPIPYVEASASTVFRSRLQRAVVAASGMAVELFIAAIAFYFWLLIEPSLLRAVLFNVMVIAGVSTLVFNGNPLLRYDAYYILSDLLEMPNLAQRANRYWGYLVERYAFGVRDASTEEEGARDKAWLLVYGLLSFAYRIFVTIAIALFIAGEFFIVGVLLAIWAIGAMAVVPLARGLRHVFASPRLRTRRLRAYMATTAFIAGVLALLFVMPAPSRTVLEGVAWLPTSALVRAEEEGFVQKVAATPGQAVRAGDVLVQMHNPLLRARFDAAQARVTELEATYRAHMQADRAQAAALGAQVEAARTERADLRARLERLAVRAGADGVFMMERPQDLPGRHPKQGELLGYVLDRPQLVARVVATQDVADLVRAAPARVQVRLASDPARVLQGRVERESPGGEEYLPSRALAVEGGGRLATDVRDTRGERTLERTFQFDVAISAPEGDAIPLYFGQRVHTRFEHPDEPIGRQWLRVARRLFLSHFHV
jgi:putative peptide zinc metalloprotease protein